MATAEGFNSRPGGARQITFWKGCHGRTSGIQFEARRRTATHILEGKSWLHVRDSIRYQEAHYISHFVTFLMAENNRSNLIIACNLNLAFSSLSYRQNYAF